MRTSRLKSSFLYSITLVSFFFCCFVRERERMKREIHSRQQNQNQNVAYIIICIRKNAHTFPRVRAFSLRGYRRERNVRSFPAASRGSRREGRVVDRFSSFFSRKCDFFVLASPSLFLVHQLFPVVREKEKEIVVLEQRRRLNATVASRGSPRFERAEYILPRRTNNKNRRRTQTTTTTHSFFFVYVYV